MFVLGSIFTFSQTTQLAAWDFENANTTPTLASGIGSATLATSGNIQRSAGLTNSYAVTNLTATTLAQAKNGAGTVSAHYISVTLVPNPNFALDISNVAIQGYSQNRNRTFNLSYIDPNSGSLVHVQNRNINTPTQSQTFNINSLTGIQTPIELRFYIFSNPADVYEAAGFGEASGLDLVINGKITNTTITPILAGMWSMQGNTVAGSQVLGSINNEALKIHTNNTEKVRITADGNVGIGTQNPSQKLSVAGNINLTGTGSGLIFDDGTFITSASKINNAVQNGQTPDVSLSGLALQNLTVSGNRINYTGAALEFYSPTQGQYNGQKPVLSMSQFGEMNFFSSPYLNDNALYLTGTGNFNNGIRQGNTFGTVTGFDGPIVFGQNGGALGSSTQNANWSATGTNVALSWNANRDVKIHKALTFADGTVQTTAGVSWGVTNNFLTYPNDVNVQGTLKLGTNSLYLGSNTTGTAGTNNYIYSDNGALEIQNQATGFQNTYINKIGGKVGIGTSVITDPWAKLRVEGKLSVLENIEITGDNPQIRIGSLVLQDLTRSLPTVVVPPGTGYNGGSFMRTQPEAFVFGNLYYDEVTQSYKSIFAAINSNFQYVPDVTAGGNAIRFNSEVGDIDFLTLPSTSNVLSISIPKADLANYKRMSIRSTGNIEMSKSVSIGENLNINGSAGVAGNLTIGVQNGSLRPQSLLQVNGNIKIFGIDNGITFMDGTKISTALWTKNNDDIYFTRGNVGIGTTATTGYKLSVEGKIRAREVDVNNLAWSDFVFDKTYKLPKLEEVEKYIKKNGHLENIPNAKTVAEKGYGLSEMDALLLRKIEELTLYTIELKKEIEMLKK